MRLPKVVSQRRAMQALLEKGIGARRGIICSHREKPYFKGSRFRRFSLTASESAQDNCILLPLFFQMTQAQQDFVVDSLAQCLSKKIT